MKISKRVRDISPSATLAITAKAKKMKEAGVDVIGFGAGEPDFDTPTKIKEAAKTALDKGFTKYTPSSGILKLKELIAKKFKNDNNLDYSPDEIIVSCGAKHSIFNAVFSLCSEGEEVIIPSPYWVSYLEMVKIAGGVPVIIKTDERNDFKIKADDLKKAVNSRTKLFILNSPSNPTGMVYDEAGLRDIAGVIADAGIYCISDEIYEKIIYEGARHISIASFGKKLKELTIVVNGVSKTYSMTGWRIGYAAGPKEIIKAMSNLQDHTTSNPVSFAQCGAVEALGKDGEEVEFMVREFKKRRDYMVSRINSIKGMSVNMPQGAFYCFVNITGLLEQGIKGSLELTDALLQDAKVAVVPGIAFGDGNFIRLSYATSMENIREGLGRIEKWVKGL